MIKITHTYSWNETISPKTLMSIKTLLQKENRPMLISEIAMKTRISPKQVFSVIDLPRAKTYGIRIFDKDSTKWKKYIYDETLICNKQQLKRGENNGRNVK